MNLQIIVPTQQLQPFIRCYYLSESNYTSDIKDVFFPDGCIEVVFHVGLNFYRGNEKENPSKVVGQITRPLSMRANGKGRTFGIWFLPHTFSLFTGVPVNELNDKAFPLDCVFDRTFVEHVRSALYQHDIATVLSTLNTYLTKRIASTTNVKDKIADHAVQYIFKERANSNLDKLASECGVSNRYIQKLFLEKVGFSPKFLIRIARFQQAIGHLAHHNSASLTELTYLTGYYDQAHFIKEFNAFTGTSPSQFHLSHHPINQYFLNL